MNSESLYRTKYDSCGIAHIKYVMVKQMEICYDKRILTVSSNSSSPSFLTWKGHQPLTLLCLNRDICGTLPSCFNMFSVHCLDDFAPRGNWLRSSVSAPRMKIRNSLFGKFYMKNRQLIFQRVK